MIQTKKLLRYFYRLSEENQELILYEMIDLYRKQISIKNVSPKKRLANYYISKGKIIYVDFKNTDS